MLILFIITVFAVLSGIAMAATGGHGWDGISGDAFKLILVGSVFGGIVLRVLGRRYHEATMKRAGWTPNNPNSTDNSTYTTAMLDHQLRPFWDQNYRKP
jgi:hypothetical protein